MGKHRVHLNGVQAMAVSFAGLIFVGALLLMLPAASRNGQSLPFLTALFTATSATCVTGLVLVDTATQFSLFGQAVLMLLIQLGGLSFMTVSILVPIMLGQRIGLRRRAVLMDTVGALQLGGVVRLARRALLVTATCEGVGAALLALWFCPRYGLGKGLWMSLFHAVSAFCNAGFDLLGTGNSLTTVAGEVLPNVVLMALVVAGGLGFLVWDDLVSHRLRVRRWHLHSKIVLTGTAVLLVGGTLAFYLLVGEGAFGGLPRGQALLMSAFQAVTPRTAGFNTVDLMELSEGSTLLTMVLMFIGAGSGSTGGGIKVNTFAVLLLAALARARRREDANIFHRRLDGETVWKAYTSTCLYSLAALVGCGVLCLEGVGLEDALFEAISAIGTVGLSRGVTPLLPRASQLAVIALMFAGRVGSMSVAMAITSSRPVPKIRNVSEKILIG